MKEKIIQLIPDIHGTSGQMTTDYYALTDKGNIWYRTSQGWQKEKLPLELSIDDPPTNHTPSSTTEGKKKAFIERMEKDLEKGNSDKSN